MSESITNLIEFYRKEILQPSAEIKQYKISKELNKFASLFVPSSFYYYVINFQNLNMDYVSEGTKELLGIAPGNFSLNELLNRIHPDDLKMMERKEALVTDFLLNYLDFSHILFYKVVYFFRVKGKGNKYRKILHQANTITVSEPDTVHHVMCIHTDVSHLPIMFDNRVSFVGLESRKSYYNLDVTSTKFCEVIKNKTTPLSLCDTLTKKEKQIVKYILKGLTGKKIAEELNISFDTVRTHRRNILAKSNCRNSSELISKCLIEGVL